ncbi:MAG TPA: isoprenoid biosynthesis glyoxalase ElbB [Bacteroidales bacterium]|nr:isoprenoid biosynthesis glyoxalase ElbB [Bacteroidales bacterium]HRZ75928.1 isoprenoid biosynthesis glyoxalase ElbB [Bacteroidales bacterium]
MKKFAVVLAGCGVYDGAEIHEATLSLWAIMKHGAEYEVFAPDKPQMHVVNHLTGQVSGETRNVLVESARIARGRIRPLEDYDPAGFDALLMPGGFGVAKNLCDFAVKGDAMSVDPQVERALRATAAAGKPIGALCIAPVILSRLFGEVRLTLGQDPGAASAVERMGSRHVMTTHGDVVTDERHKIFTTPCYMLDANILQIAEGAENIVKAILASLR